MNRIRRKDGSALIVVLWIIGLLSILMTAFIFDAHIEARITSYYRKRMKADHLAESGIKIAEMLMVKRNEITGTEEIVDESDRWYEHAKKLKKGGVWGLEEKLGDGTITLDIVPETARRDINHLGKNDLEIEENLERILTVGGITEETGMWPGLIESFLDWIDKDQEPRVDGAETEDYYSTLENPFKARNGPLETVGELKSIKGFDGKDIKGFNGDILRGGVIRGDDEDEDPIVISGIEDLLTTYGGDKINPNIASMRVLMTLPNVDEVVAGAIKEERDGVNYDDEDSDEDYSFKSIADFNERMGLQDQGLEKWLSIGSGVFRVTSVGEYGGVKRKIWCIIRYENKEITILRWKEAG